MSERLERVTAFSELRAGMIVVLKPCAACGLAHRFMLLSQWEGLSLSTSGTIVDVPAWTYAPAAPCDRPPFEVLGHPPVDRGAVYRVLDGLEEPSTETAAASPTKQHAKENA